MSSKSNLVLRQLIIHSLIKITLLVLGTFAFSVIEKERLLASTVTVPVNQNSNRAKSEIAYTLGAGDRIQIDIFKLPQYSGQYEVLVNGSINLPTAGSVSIQGMTLEQAAKVIAAKYKSARILRQPQVTVTLLVPRPLKIGIAGEVNRPGSYTMVLEGSKFPTVTRAVEIAGGITQAADIRNVQVRRSQRSGSNKVFTVNLWTLVQTGILSDDVTLRDGDTIFIPTLAQVNLAEASQLTTASFSAAQTGPITVAVIGEVSQPGTHTVTGATDTKTGATGAGQGGGKVTTLTRALEVAGGIKPMADIRHIQIRRPTKTGSEQIIEVNLWQLLQAGDLQQDIPLQDRDTVIVPTSTTLDLVEASQLSAASFSTRSTQPVNVSVVGEVFRPGSHPVAGTLTKAIQTAGGIKPMADIRQIQLRRLASNGAEQVIAIDFWKLLQGGDLRQDVLLQEGDTIFIPTATAIEPSEATQIAAASFSPEKIKVYVVGEIKNAGVIEVPPNTPLNQALLAAGGFTKRSDEGSVELIRLNSNGSVLRREVSLNFDQGINEQTNPALRNNDVIVVGSNTLTDISDTLGTAISPLGSFLNLFTFPSQLFNLFK